ncbi:MAG: signal peptidase I [Minisyncoccia bacterium]
MSKENLRIFWAIIFSLLIFFILILGKNIISSTKENDNQTPKISSEIPQDLNDECSIKIEEKIVRGSSMEPVLKEGQTVKILFGYYNCHPVEREDIIVYDFKGNEAPIIKRVKGIEGDSFHLEKTEGGWLILIHGEPIKNSKGEYYVIPERGYKMLSLYERDYKGKIPEGAYLILGEEAKGTLDSTYFGLVGKNDILGKVEY